MTNIVASGFSCQIPARRRQLNRPTPPALPPAVPSRWHWPTKPSLLSHRCRHIALALAAIEAAFTMNGNKDFKDPMDEDTLSVPKQVPQTYEFKGEIFYVRKCYNEYYNQIMDLLKKDLYITVTGTEGIGKSLFYLYFFQRYRKEFPHKALVTASFSNDRELIECMLFRHDRSERRPVIPKRGLPDWPANFDCDLYLYNGPPRVRPSDVKMIAFTSPNDGWLHSMFNNQAHAEVYMPTWTLDELLIAVNVLKLDISKEELDRRFTFFGGSARYCLAADADFLVRGRDRVTKALSKITGNQQLERLFNGDLDHDKVVHRLMSNEPEPDKNWFHKLVPASNMIKGLLVERISAIFFQDNPMYWLERAYKASAFYLLFFENRVHDVLLKGGNFEIRSLLDSALQPLQLNKMVGHYHRFHSNISREGTILDVYRIDKSSSHPPINSYMVTESGLLIFQVTIQSMHEIKASGLVDVLRKVQMLEHVSEHPESAKIIVVVPEGMGPQFQKQKIANVESPFCSDLENADFTEVTWISYERERQLAEQNISNCKQLILAYDNGEACVNFVKKKIAALKNRVETNDRLEFLTKIPQYVLEIGINQKSRI